MVKYNYYSIPYIMIVALSLLFCISFNANGYTCKLYNFNQSLNSDPSWTLNHSLDDTYSEIQASDWTRVSDDSRVSPWSLSTGKLKLQGYYNITKRVSGPGNVTFWWKKTKSFDKIGTQLYVVIDDSVKGAYNNQSFDWVNQPPLEFGPGTHNITWVFRIKVLLPSFDAQGWIDETVICESTGNHTPAIIGLIPNKQSPQVAGETITWTTMASDPENDQLLYKFRMNGADITGWTTLGTWSWNSTEAKVGSNWVEVWLRDGKHAGPEGFDDRKTAGFEITQKPIIFDVRSSEELEQAINNRSYLEKRVLLRSGVYLGSFKINNIFNMTIEPNPDNSDDVVLNASGNDFNIAIENRSKNIAIKGLKLINGNSCILMEDVGDCSIIDNKLESFRINGISLNSSSNNNIINNTIKTTSSCNVAGINLTDSKGVQIRNNLIDVNCSNDKSHITILLKRSCNNVISLKISKIIPIFVEDDWQCSAHCSNGTPVRCTGSDDTHCDCMQINQRKCNEWDFQC